MLSDTAGDTPSRPSLENLGSLSSTENIVIKLPPVFQLPVLGDTTGQWRLGLPVCMKSTIPIDISAPRNREFDHVISNPQYKSALNPQADSTEHADCIIVRLEHGSHTSLDPKFYLNVTDTISDER